MITKLLVVLVIYLTCGSTLPVTIEFINSTLFDDAIVRARSFIVDESVRLKKYVGRLSHLLYPSTNFCGYGNIAQKFNDLGDDAGVDSCCRTHDYCYQNIMPNEHKFNLTNNHYFTSVNCECDNSFKNCLRNINKTNANIVGTIYFDILGHTKRCFDKRYPISKCTKNVTKYLYSRCVEYEYDNTRGKIYQWFDLPLYYMV